MTKHSTRRTPTDPRRDGGEAAVPMADRLLLSEPEVAALCGVSRHTVRRWKAAGLLRDGGAALRHAPQPLPARGRRGVPGAGAGPGLTQASDQCDAPGR